MPSLESKAKGRKKFEALFVKALVATNKFKIWDDGVREGEMSFMFLKIETGSFNHLHSGVWEKEKRDAMTYFSFSNDVSKLSSTTTTRTNVQRTNFLEFLLFVYCKLSFN